MVVFRNTIQIDSLVFGRSFRCCWSARSRIFHSYIFWDVTIAGEGLQNLDLGSSLIDIEQRRMFSMSHLCDTGIHLKRSSPRNRETHTCCRSFGSWIDTVCFNDLGLSQPGFELKTFRIHDKSSKHMRHMHH